MPRRAPVVGEAVPMGNGKREALPVVGLAKQLHGVDRRRSKKADPARRGQVSRGGFRRCEMKRSIATQSFCPRCGQRLGTSGRCWRCFPRITDLPALLAIVAIMLLACI